MNPIDEVQFESLSERFRQEGFTLLHTREVWRVALKGAFKEWYPEDYLTPPLRDVPYWTSIVVIQAIMTSLGVYVRGYEWWEGVIIFLLGCALAAAFRFGWYFFLIRRARRSFINTFGMGYDPTADQVGRVRSVSRWMSVIGSVSLEDGRTVVVVRVPTSPFALFVVDTYRPH